MTDREIIAELVHGERNIIEDAESVEQRDTFAAEARHTDGRGASVILSFNLTSAWRSDAESESMREFDIWSADPEPPTDAAETATEDGDTQ